MKNQAQFLNSQESPFHQGEQEIQEKFGVREKMEKFGRQVIRNFLPEQHREFYQQLPYILAGHMDKEGWPWASVLFGSPGFITTPDHESLSLQTKIPKGDPLLASLNSGLQLGLLGIDLSSRRRNRLSTTVVQVGEDSFDMDVVQSFGNCPQYIQTRHVDWSQQLCPEPAVMLDSFNEEISTFITNSDTFFVASHYQSDEQRASDGADVSHRGGKPGFVRVDSATQLTIPDYLGNFHFNTLGNFLVNPKAGLLFVDFEKGHILTLTGRVEILWDSEETEYFKGAERLWQFHLEKGFLLKHALPFKFNFDEFSPTTLVTGSWQESLEQKEAGQLKNSWQNCVVERIEKESELVKSFYLKPESGLIPTFKAGQFLTVKAEVNGSEFTRTYTVSSAPNDDYYRLSVKREESGIFSSFLHQQVQEGDVLQFKAPAGKFFLDTDAQHPAVLIAGGIGITPMISMLRHIVQDSVRTRSMRPTVLICALRNLEQRSFYQELEGLVKQASGYIGVYWVLSDPEDDAVEGKNYHYQGRVNRDFLQAVLPIGSYEFFLCGPPGFMQAMYDLCLDLGVSDRLVQAESFGPASLIRRLEKNVKAEKKKFDAAENAVVEFSQSQFEQAWSKEDGSLLEFAEAHGLTPEYGCRSGQCGSCKVKLKEGQVSYAQIPACDYSDDEVVLCCAVPAQSDKGIGPKVKLEL